MGHKKRKRKDVETEEVQKRKHYDAFYAGPPPGMVKEHEERLEESIPDQPENKDARDFLAHAPTKGLWMPLGKEVKVMQCWRCKQYGHRTGDKECKLFLTGNVQTERLRWSHEDPMHDYVKDQERRDKEERVKQLQSLLVSSSSSSSSSSDSSSSEDEHRKRKRRKRDKKTSSKDRISKYSDKKKVDPQESSERREKSHKKKRHKGHKHGKHSHKKKKHTNQ